MTEDEMVGCHCQLNGHEFEQTLRDSEGPGSLACYSAQGHKESYTTGQLNNSKKLDLSRRKGRVCKEETEQRWEATTVHNWSFYKREGWKLPHQSEFYGGGGWRGGALQNGNTVTGITVFLQIHMLTS